MRCVVFSPAPPSVKSPLTQRILALSMGESLEHTFDFEPNKNYARITSWRINVTVDMRRLSGFTYRITNLGPRGKWSILNHRRRLILNRLTVLSPAEAKELASLNRRHAALLAAHGKRN